MTPHIGIAGTLFLIFAEDWNRLTRKIHPAWRILQVHLRLRGYATSVTLRLGSSDFEVFQQIFVQQLYMPVTAIKDPAVIVDCGANVGYSALYFLQHFPRARVIALEPDPLNAELCRHNLRHYGDRVVIIQKALWGSVATLGFVAETRKAGEEWAIEVQTGAAKSAPNTVESIDIPSLIAAAGVKQIDVLKIDIEKSEADVFQTNPAAWLPLVRTIAIELHGPVCNEIFRCALSNFSFLEESRGDVTFCLGINRRACASPPSGI
jgi:FkbM family methyltransferase